jgi:hypothetical protein
MKKCPRCNLTKSLDQFYVYPAGNISWCNECINTYNRESYRKTHPRNYRRFDDIVPNGRKWCRDCQQWVLIESFNKKQGASDGRTSICISCQSDRNLLRLYNLTRSDFNSLLDSQGGGCACCGTKIPGGKGAFHVDHNHETGQVRGLLCHRCNTAIGQFEDNPKLLRLATAYLESYE